MPQGRKKRGLSSGRRGPSRERTRRSGPRDRETHFFPAIAADDRIAVADAPGAIAFGPEPHPRLQERHVGARLIDAVDLPWTPFLWDAGWRSRTVHCWKVDDPDAWHERALAAGFRLGNGYGRLRDTCIRIATFPAHSETDVMALLTALAP